MHLVLMKGSSGKKKLFGLVGKNLSYSFSLKYFKEKFQREFIKDSEYKVFDIENLTSLKKILKNPYLKGLNVTVPYKEKILPFLTDLSLEAKRVGAVNTIKIEGEKYIGHNTDIYGFEHSFKRELSSHHKKALIFGTGGAAKAVSFVLRNLGIEYLFVCRAGNKKTSSEAIFYKQINEAVLKEFKVLINATPVGTYPNVDESPFLPYQYICSEHYLYDLVYNPLQTSFLNQGIQRNATVKNGLEMLYLQAEYSWKLWNQ